jgi:hypothetical protein
MVKCKRMLASLLSIMMVFSFMAVPTYAASTNDSDDYIYAENLYNDVSADDSFYTALAILSRLDIIVGDDKGNFNPDNTITRAEAAAVVVRLTGMSDTYTGSLNTQFVDVPSSHWASGVIATANSMGIVEGYGNGYFGPEDPVKYEEIVTMIIRAMGYDPMVETRGSSWPGNYLSVASTIGVRSTEGGSVGKEAPRKVVASLLYSALKAPLMEVVSWGSRTEYAIMDGSNYELKTLLSENFDVYILKALVDSTDKASLSGSVAREDCAKLEILDAYDVEYFEEMKDDNDLLTVYENGMLRNYLGSTITAFVLENDENYADYDLIAFTAIEDEEDVVVIPDAENIILTGSSKVTKNFGNGNNSKPVIAYYDEDDKVRTETIDLDARILMNDEFYANVKDSDVDNDIFDIEDASVTFKDTNSDGDFDIISIDRVVIFVVDEVNEKYLKITDANNYYTALRFDDYYNDEIDYTIKDTKGNVLDFEDLKQYDVLTIRANALKDNGKIDNEKADYYNIVVSRETVEGVVKTKGSNWNGKPEYTIEGEEYTIVPNIMGELDLGDEGVFYLDSMGRIAYYEYSNVSDKETASNYGYIVKTAVDDYGFDEEIWFKIVTDEGDVETYEAPAKAITIYDRNGDSHRVHAGSTTSSYEGFEDEGWDDALEGQLVAYRLNSEGEISKIYLAEGRDDNASTFSLDKTVTGARFKESAETLGAIDVDEDTIVFFIPSGTTDEDDIEVGTIANLEDDEYYDAEAYHMTRDYVARILVVSSEMTSINLKGNVYVVQGVSHAVMDDEDREVSQKLELLYKGEKEELWVSPDESEFDVERGDVITVKLNSANEIVDIKVLYDVSEEDVWDVTAVRQGGSAVEDLYTVAGYVTYKKSKTVTIAADPTDTTAESFYAQNAYVYLVDGNSYRSNVKVADFSDIEEYEDNEDLVVFARIYEDEITDIVIYDDVISTPSTVLPSDPEEDEEEEVTYTYVAGIDTDTFAYGTVEADVISEITLERFIDGVEDDAFIMDASKIAITGYDAEAEGTQRLTVSYDGVNALNKVNITVEAPVVAYTCEDSVTVDFGATVADVLEVLNVEKTVGGEVDDTFVADSAALDLGTFDEEVLGAQTVTVTYDSVEIGEVEITVEDYLTGIACDVMSITLPAGTEVTLVNVLDAFLGTVTAEYASTDSEVLTDSDYSVSLDSGNLVIEYEGFDITITVIAGLE